MATNTMATSGVVSDIFKVTRGFGGLEANAKVNIGKLYMRQIMKGPGVNQSEVIEPNAVTGLGKTGVNNWTIFDGPGPQANLIANGQGMHTFAGNWNQWFTMVFKVERFKGSTLQVMGASADNEENEWAIDGGTGEFTMARGIIKRRVYNIVGDTLTQELTIEFFCRMKEVVPAPTKRGPWGVNGAGFLHEMTGKSQRLESVRINIGAVVHSIEFSYIDGDGKIHVTGFWGEFWNNEINHKTETIRFGPSEFVKQITGTFGTSPWLYISNFQIMTNITTYGPFGTFGGGTTFRSTVPADETVVGFFAKTDRFVHTIGVYTI